MQIFNKKNIPIPVSYILLNKEQVICDVSSAFVSLLGLKSNILTGKKITTLLPANEQSEFESFFQTVIFIQSIGTKTFHIKVESGDYIEILFTAQYLAIGDEQFLVSTIIETGLEKIAQPSLNEASIRYKSIFRNEHTAMLVIDPTNGRIIDSNLAAEKFYGYTHKEFSLLDISKIASLSTKDLIGIFKTIQEEGKYTSILEHKLANGETRIVQTLSSEIIFVNKPMIYSIVLDITHQKKAEAELQKSQKRLLRAEQVAQIGYWEIDMIRQTVSTSAIARFIYGIEKECLTIEEIQRIPLPEYRPQLDEALKELIAKGKVYDVEFKIKHPTDGNIVDIHSMAEYDPEKKTVFGVLQDITERKKVEIDLFLAKEKAEESDKLKSAFLANMSHEIRTPMNGIIGFSEMLSKTNIDDQTRLYYTQVIIESSHRLLAIVNDILEISRIETGQIKVVKTPVSVNSMLEKVYTNFTNKKNQKNISFKLLNNEALPPIMVYTDEAKLGQILENLVNNAFKFTEEGFIHMGCKRQADSVLFFVEDSGIGIDENLHEIIFERFRQADMATSRKYGGTGLGLAIAKKFVDLLEGKLWVESSPGKGSKFLFSLPLYQIQPTTELIVEKSFEKSTLKKEKSNYTVLIAEDEEVNYMYISEVLDELNYTLLHAWNGLEAVELSRKHPETDLILMDIKMPKMDGYEATHKIRAFRPNTPIIAQTAYALIEDREKALAAGCNDYVTKPILANDLLNLVVSYCRKEN